MIKKKIQQEAITIFGATIAVTIMGFLSTMYFAHVLGKDILGMYYIFLSVCGILTLFSDAGLGAATTKRISEGMERGEYWTGSVFTRIVTYVIIIIIIYVFRDYFNNLIGMNILSILFLVIGLNILNSFFSCVIVGLDHIKLSALSALFNNFGRLSVQVLLVFFGWQLFGLIYGYVFGIISGILIILYSSIRYDIRVKPVICRYRHIKSLLSYSIFTFLNGVGGMIFEYADLIIIGMFLSKGDAGIYGAIWSFSSISLFVSNAIWTTMFPKISRWSTDGNWSYVEQSLEMAITYSLILAVPILFGGIILGKNLLYYGYGASFSSGTLALIIILFMRIFQILSNLMLQYLQGINHPDLVFRVRSVTAMLNILLDWFLVQIYGIEGAAVATLITVFVASVLGVKYVKNIIKININYTLLWAILLASVIMSLIVYIISSSFSECSLPQVLIEVVIGALIYGLVLIGINEDIRNEVMNLRRIKII